MFGGMEKDWSKEEVHTFFGLFGLLHDQEEFIRRTYYIDKTLNPVGVIGEMEAETKCAKSGRGLCGTVSIPTKKNSLRLTIKANNDYRHLCFKIIHHLETGEMSFTFVGGSEVFSSLEEMVLAAHQLHMSAAELSSNRLTESAYKYPSGNSNIPAPELLYVYPNMQYLNMAEAGEAGMGGQVEMRKTPVVSYYSSPNPFTSLADLGE